MAKNVLAAIFSFVIVMTNSVCCTFADEAAFGAVMDERGIYACLSSEEVELLTRVNIYRGSHGLPPIANSRSLNKVARVHVLDLDINLPAEGKDIHGDECNLHSWSYKGFWTPVCYTRESHNPEAIWNKAKEITSYVYSGSVYENAYWASLEEGIPLRALNAWKKSPKHNALILEAAEWKGENFQAIGVGIYKGFAVMWVGKANDSLGPLEACSTRTTRTIHSQ